MVDSGDVSTILRELTAVARRGRARSRAQVPELSLVEHSILDHLHDHPGSRAADLAAWFLLDKSTVSRQLAALTRRGLLDQQPDPEGRGKGLRLTPAGEAAIAASRESQRQALEARLAGWSAAEVRAFARALERFNREDP